VSGVIEPIGGPAKLFLFLNRKPVPQEEVSAPVHGHAADLVLSWIGSGRMSSHGIGSTKDLDVVAYRVVHGGDCYSDPVRIDDEVIATIERLEDLAAES
jgi:acetate kinase